MHLMMSENIARNMYSNQGTINYPTQLHLVGHFQKFPPLLSNFTLSYSLFLFFSISLTISVLLYLIFRRNLDSLFGILTRLCALSTTKIGRISYSLFLFFSISLTISILLYLIFRQNLDSLFGIWTRLCALSTTKIGRISYSLFLFLFYIFDNFSSSLPYFQT